MTTRQAQRLATKAGYECYYDPSIRLWAVYRLAFSTPAQYFTASIISDMTAQRFTEIYLDHNNDD